MTQKHLTTVFAIKSSFFITISLFDVNNNDYNNTGVILKNNMENATTADSVTSNRPTYKTTVIRQNQ